MKRLIFLMLCLPLLVSIALSDDYFISSTSPGAAPEAEGLVSAAVGVPTTGFLLDDWTYTTGASQLSSPKFADLNGDGIDEIIFTTYGVSTPYGAGVIYAWDGAGNVMPGFPLDITGAPPGTPAIGDIDNDGDVEIVQGTWNFLYVLNADGSNFPGWPIPLYVTQSSALADLDDDGDLEIIVPSSGSMKVYHHNGTPFPGFPVTAANTLTGASVGDLDGDGDLEIVAGTYVASGSISDFVYAWHHTGEIVAGFPVSTSGSVKAAPATADLDNDGSLEIIAGCWNIASGNNDYLYVWNHTGELEPGWPINASYIRLSSPSVADFDLDGDLEIVIGGWSTSPYGEKIFAYHHNAAPVTGFPVTLINDPSGNINSTPVTGDIDGDGYIEIVVKVKNKIYALNHDGSVVTGFPVYLDDQNHSGTISPTPAIGDPDGDGLVEIFAASSYTNVMLLDQTGAYSPGLNFWPTFRNDPWNNGCYFGEFTPPDITVTLTPVNPPIVIPASGGIFEYNIAFSNNGANPANFDSWAMVTLPSGTQMGPVLGPVNMNLSAGGSLDRDRQQAVPSRAPSGEYTYHACAGIYPNAVWAGDSFNFSKSAAGDGIVYYESWTNIGEPFGGEIPFINSSPLNFALMQNYPNPFNAETVIPLQLPEISQVRLEIYNINGRLIDTILDGTLEAGWSEVKFDASYLSSGVYFYRVIVNGGETGVNFSGAGKMLLTK
ncbi:MAG: T9SS type A sorting domain-containing protein [candidate division Zixibacteria bacterium]|nr:T9SS type A sorting domain-containing protein [Candidatus Tariuqbacter arcticus]